MAPAPRPPNASDISLIETLAGFTVAVWQHRAIELAHRSINGLVDGVNTP